MHEFCIIDQRDLYVNKENFIEYKKKLDKYLVKVQTIENDSGQRSLDDICYWLNASDERDIFKEL